MGGATRALKGTAAKAGENLALAIPLRISGENAVGVAFEEVTNTVLITRKGGNLLTRQELAEGSFIKVKALTTGRTLPARIVRLGEMSGNRREISVEIEDAETLWGVQFPKSAQAALQARAQELASGPVPAALPAAPAASVSAEPAEPAATRLANAQAQFDSAVLSHSERLEIRAIEIVTRNQQALENNIQNFMDSSELELRRRHMELAEQTAAATRNHMLEMALAARTRVQQEVAEELPQIENRFTEQIRSRAEHILSCHMEEAGNSLSNGVRDAEEEMARQLASIAGRFAADLEQRCEEALADSITRVEQRLEEAAERIGQSFTRHVISELNEKYEEWSQQAQRTIEESAEQSVKKTRAELARLVHGLGDSL